MTGISAQNGVITLINVFTVDSENQRRHIELLTEATDVSVRRAPGFVSAFIAAKTAQGSRCTLQWQSIDHYHLMRRDPVALPFLEGALKIAKFEPGIYEVVQTFTPVGETK